MTIFAPLRRDGSPFRLAIPIPRRASPGAAAFELLEVPRLRLLPLIRRAARGTLRSSKRLPSVIPYADDRTSTNTIDTRWRSPTTALLAHTSPPGRSALLAPNHWTPIRGSGKDISSSREPPRKGTRARSGESGPSPSFRQGVAGLLKQTADRLAPQLPATGLISREQSPAEFSRAA